jgi:hypothetical protein
MSRKHENTQLIFCLTESNLINPLYIDDSTKLLNSVQQNISLLDDSLVLRILIVWSVRLDNAVDFINYAVQPSICNEL